MQVDQVVLVDEQDRKIGLMDKLEAHKGEGTSIKFTRSQHFIYGTQRAIVITLQMRSADSLQLRTKEKYVIARDISPDISLLGACFNLGGPPPSRSPGGDS